MRFMYVKLRHTVETDTCHEHSPGALWSSTQSDTGTGSDKVDIYRSAPASSLRLRFLREYYCDASLRKYSDHTNSDNELGGPFEQDELIFM